VQILPVDAETSRLFGERSANLRRAGNYPGRAAWTQRGGCATLAAGMDDAEITQLTRVRAEYAGDESHLLGNLTRQDSIILNRQRACEAAIDLAMHLVRVRRLGVPQETREASLLLRDAGLIPADLADRMLRMVGFGNVAIHDYRRLDLAIVKSIVADHLDDFTAFARAALAAA
jgi:uncharacterized protein YutE (UPF0331/DUF86 family)